MEGKQSFIGEARREQIIEATIQTLDEIGYVKSSLAQIAKRAGISTALISYHFEDKNDLMNHLLAKLLEESTLSILKRVHQETTPERKIEAFITESLMYQGTHPERNTALIEIIFNARTPENVPYYKLSDENDTLMDELKAILHEGQTSGSFGDFNTDIMASMIQGAIGEYMFHSTITKKMNWETYSKELVKVINQSLK